MSNAANLKPCKCGTPIDADLSMCDACIYAILLRDAEERFREKLGVGK